MELGIPLATGNTAALYVSGERVIKLFNEGLPDDEAKREAESKALLTLAA